jgi:hypothetical protein
MQSKARAVSRCPRSFAPCCPGSCPLNVSAKVLWGLLLRHHQDHGRRGCGADVWRRHRAAVNDAISGLFEEAFNFGPSDERSTSGSKIEWSIKAFLIEWVRLGGSAFRVHSSNAADPMSRLWRGWPPLQRGSWTSGIVTAWHTAVFALSGYSGKLKPLSEFLSSKPES